MSHLRSSYPYVSSPREVRQDVSVSITSLEHNEFSYSRLLILPLWNLESFALLRS